MFFVVTMWMDYQWYGVVVEESFVEEFCCWVLVWLVGLMR